MNCLKLSEVMLAANISVSFALLGRIVILCYSTGMQNIIEEKSLLSRLIGLTMLELVIASSIVALTTGILFSGLSNYQDREVVSASDQIRPL